MFMYFSDVWAKFYDFIHYCFVLLPQMDIGKTPITSSFKLTRGYGFVDIKHFFVEI